MSEKDNSVPPLSFEIERQARIKRSVVIQSCVRGTIPPIRAFGWRNCVLRYGRRWIFCPGFLRGVPRSCDLSIGRRLSERLRHTL